MCLITLKVHRTFSRFSPFLDKKCTNKLKNSTIKNPQSDNPRVRQVPILRVDTEGVAETDDALAAEEPLEIVLAFGQNNQRKRQSISVTMRTPTGHDFELALGFLWAEGVISSVSDVLSVRYTASKLDESAQTNVVQVDLHPSLKFDFERLNRHFSFNNPRTRGSVAALRHPWLPAPAAPRRRQGPVP